MRFKQVSAKLPDGTSLLLREVRKSDAKALNRIVQEPGVTRFMLLTPPVPLSSTTRHVREVKATGGLWLAAVAGGQVVGNVEVHPGVGRRGHVWGFGIAFSKKVHGKGVAAAALGEVFKFAKKNGCRLMSIECFQDNPRARAFYAKMGFRQAALLKARVRRGKRFTGSVLLEKKL